MTTIAQLAQKSGLELVLNGGLIEARQGKKVIAFHSDRKTALNRALERLEEVRLRELDKTPESREPVLRVKKKAVVEELVVIEPSTPALPLVVIKGSIIKSKYKDRYKPKHGSCGDLIADELREYLVVLKDGQSRLSVERLREIAEANGVWRDSYLTLNVGQQRMNIGNRLRAIYAEGSEINIGGAIFQKKIPGI